MPAVRGSGRGGRGGGKRKGEGGVGDWLKGFQKTLCTVATTIQEETKGPEGTLSDELPEYLNL